MPPEIDIAIGDSSDIAFPAHPGAFLSAGPGFLNKALRAFGCLPADNQIVCLTRCEPFLGGSTGKKLLVSVEYGSPDATLERNFFVKFSRDFDDAIRDRQKGEMESEVRLALLSRHPAFPIAVPRTFFADFDSNTGTGLLITSIVKFGQDKIEPHRQKCMDHDIPNPLAYYRAIFRALARLVAAHKSGRLDGEVERVFPFDLSAAISDERIPYDERALRAQIGRFASLAEIAPQLFPPHVIRSSFLSEYTEQAVRVLAHEAALKRFLHADMDYVALCHWNANIDNAWFWRDATGRLQCGLFDWGQVRQMNVAYALWGCLLGAPLAIWDEHLDDLLELFATEVRENGGPTLSVDQLRLHLELYVAWVGLAAAIVAPDRILMRLPDAVTARGPRDSMFLGSPQARNYLHLFTNFLNFWSRTDLDRSLDTMLDRLRRG